MDSSALASSPGPARPVAASERLALLDALRGFALLGVFVSNVSLWFSGRVFWPGAQMKALMEGGAWYDKATVIGIQLLVFGKFITIFAFLFGLGFAVQLGRASARGGSVVPVYVKRLLALFAIGVTHLFVIWYGDVLSTYAVLGFSLLLLYKLKDRALLWTAGVLAFVSPLVVMLVQRWPQLMGTADPEALKAAQAASGALRAGVLEAITGGTYLEVVRAQAKYFLGDFVWGVLGLVGTLIARFALGLWAGRAGVFHAPGQHRRFFRRLLGWGLVMGLTASAIGMVVQVLAMRQVIKPQEIAWLPFVFTLVRHCQELGMASVYVATFTLLFQREAWQRVLGLLAPVGRMALSNYLTQSVVSVVAFYGYGLGLISRLGVAGAVGFALAVFAVQVLVSHLWLSRFQFGPAEWVWRSLTYGQLQPMRRPAAPVSAAVVHTA